MTTHPDREVTDRVEAPTFKELFRHYPNGVAIITADGPEGPVGFTATSVTSISADPPVLSFSITNTASSWPTIAVAESVVIHFLDTSHIEESTIFSTSGIDRFAQVDWHKLATGEPHVRSIDTWVRGPILHRIPAGSSTIVLVGAAEAQIGERGAPLVYHDRHYHSLTPLSIYDGTTGG